MKTLVILSLSLFSVGCASEPVKTDYDDYDFSAMSVEKRRLTCSMMYDDYERLRFDITMAGSGTSSQYTPSNSQSGAEKGASSLGYALGRWLAGPSKSQRLEQERDQLRKLILNNCDL